MANSVSVQNINVVGWNECEGFYKIRVFRILCVRFVRQFLYHVSFSISVVVVVV